MTRRDKILEYVSTQNKAVTTNEIATKLGFLRNNVSKELNILVRAGQLQKIKGRPVKYQSLGINTIRLDPFLTKEEQVTDKTGPDSSIFDTMIGQNESLQMQIKQAKAAVLYPPHGLNVLITGPTGSGKTYFANAMHQFALKQAVIQNKELVTFNCADYAHNPQLLMSHLFGYVKGAFTGAQEDRDGLIQKADGGLLFLDEVHRLPPEGQEMIFYFMDHGTYSKLGEIAKVHHANVRLICATTEDPESSLLQTFVRRIPISITMPQFDERTVAEQLALMKRLVTIEANRTNKNIRLPEDVAKALIGSVTFGNVGQLKSNIQLVCAQGFLNSVDKEQIELTFDQLPQNIKDGMSKLANDRKRLGELSKLLEPYLVLRPDGETELSVRSDRYELPYNLYETIGNKAALLKEEGLEKGAINNFIMTDINMHLKSFYRDTHTQTEKNLKDIVDNDTLQLTKDIERMLADSEAMPADENFTYALSLHLSSFIKRIHSGKPMREVPDDLLTLVNDHPKEMKVAKKIKYMLEDYYDFKVPDSEVYYLAVLLISLNSVPKHGKVGVVVAAHGAHTASSMVQVVSKLLNIDNILAFDMPLEMSPSTALEQIMAKVSQIDRGSGVLLLVDMGSLSTFSAKISEKTGVKVKTIDMVTTAMVLEAARKTALIDSDLDLVYHELKDFNGYFRNSEEITDKKEQLEDLRPRAILALCSTGKGTAEKIKELLDNILADQLIDDVTVLTLSVVDLDKKLDAIKAKYRLVATTGVLDPKLAPHISLEELFYGEQGKRQLVRYLEASETWYVENKPAPAIDQKTAANYLEQYYTFINPKKMIGVLWQYCDILAKELELELTDTKRLALIMHLGGAVERILLQSPVSLNPEQEVEYDRNNWQEKLALANEYLRNKLNLRFPKSEEYYIAKLIDTELV